MQFVFGNTFVCSISEIANKLAFTDNIKVKCVNLDGDIFDPTGLINGGGHRKGESILKKVVELTNIQKKILMNQRLSWMEFFKGKRKLMNIPPN